MQPIQRKQIKDMLKAGKLSHIIREMKQNSVKEQPKKKGETSEKEKPQAILMIQSRKKAISGEIKWPLGQITLLVKVRDDEHSTSAWMDFQVVRSTSPFNEIIGNRGLRKMKAIPINNARNDKVPGYGRNTYAKNLDIFAWTPTDMAGVPRQIAEHKLNLRKGCQPVRQKKKGQAAERNIAINDEFETTNNEAEYEALIAGLRIAEKMGVKNLEVNVDSKLVANQVNGTYIAKETDMIKYLEKQTSVSGGIERKIRKRKRGAHRGRGRRGYLDDPDS
ncbi:reverse transcriptase domain-containing protein [Tanacetum coccineum]|uniref:Reverse transcriptase domain-containing protein n=1 Tax=Tanacetum coccineum TaxID=301880 RepID=A0ABQ5JDD7_9ASTR